MWLPGFWKLVAWRARRHRESERTLSLARLYVRWRPSDPYSWNLLGDVLIRKEDFREAEAALREGIRRHPAAAELTYLLSQALREQGKMRDAAEVLRSQEERTPESIFCYLGHLGIAMQEGKTEEALNWASKAATVVPPTWPWTKYEIAWQILPIPQARGLARRLLQEASEELPSNLGTYATSHLLLAATIEKTSPSQAAEHLAIARKHWRGRKSLEEVLESTRKLLENN